jgi:hypothetical protein
MPSVPNAAVTDVSYYFGILARMSADRPPAITASALVTWTLLERK